jgi:hypothetical protein
LRVELANGHYAMIRDVMLRGDRRAAQKHVQIHVLPDGTRVLPMGTAETVIGSLLQRMLIEWDTGQPLPSSAHNDDLAQNILDSLDDRDMDKLRDAVRPFVNRVLGADGDPRTKALAALAEEHPERFAELLADAETGADAGGERESPKRVLTATAISTSAE